MTTAVANYDPTNFGELETFAKRMANTGLVPQAFKGKPEEIMAAILLGSELGLRPLSALNSIAVINGRPAVWGDALPGLAMSKGLVRSIREHFEGEPFQDTYTAVCEVMRADGSHVIQKFSVADAKRAGLWEKAGPWRQYSRRMLQIRARSFAIRDAAPHLLFGNTAEELQDIDTSAAPRGPENARDITPEQPATGPRTAAEAAMVAAEVVEPLPDDEDSDPLRIEGLSAKEALGTLQWELERCDAARADQIYAVYRDRIAKFPPKIKEALDQLIADKIGQEYGGRGEGAEQGELV